MIGEPRRNRTVNLRIKSRAQGKLGLFYVRFMDDIVVLSPTRWKLRKAIAVLNGVLSSLRLEKHPDKTYIGRIEKGFDFLGYHFGPEGLSDGRGNVEEIRRTCDPAL